MICHLDTLDKWATVAKLCKDILVSRFLVQKQISFMLSHLNCWSHYMSNLGC